MKTEFVMTFYLHRSCGPLAVGRTLGGIRGCFRQQRKLTLNVRSFPVGLRLLGDMVSEAEMLAAKV
jgi:hypothetical protein